MDTFPAVLASGDIRLVSFLAADPGTRALRGDEGLEAAQRGLTPTADSVCWLPLRKEELLEP